MSLETQINEDLKEAMKAKDQVALRGIRAIKSAILIFKTSGSNEVLDDTNEIKLLQKLVKQRKDSLEIYRQQNRPELASIEEEEIAIIEKYLPKQVSLEELKKVIMEVISEINANGMKDMGKVMGIVSQRLSGKAEGKVISEVVKRLLSQ